MKIPCTLTNALLIIRDHFGLSFASKGLGYLAALCLLLSLLARYKLSCYQPTLLLTISALADITLLKTTCHFLLLLVWFDTLTYRKELQLIPYTCGSSTRLWGCLAIFKMFCLLCCNICCVCLTAFSRLVHAIRHITLTQAERWQVFHVYKQRW